MLTFSALESAARERFGQAVTIAPSGDGFRLAFPDGRHVAFPFGRADRERMADEFMTNTVAPIVASLEAKPPNPP
jgi:hypothetical protein